MSEKSSYTYTVEGPAVASWEDHMIVETADAETLAGPFDTEAEAEAALSLVQEKLRLVRGVDFAADLDNGGIEIPPGETRTIIMRQHKETS